MEHIFLVFKLIVWNIMGFNNILYVVKWQIKFDGSFNKRYATVGFWWEAEQKAEGYKVPRNRYFVKFEKIVCSKWSFIWLSVEIIAACKLIKNQYSDVVSLWLSTDDYKSPSEYSNINRYLFLELTNEASVSN